MIDIHVSPTGCDGRDGSPCQPVATLTGARDRIRSLRRQSRVNTPVTVWIHAGCYELVEPFVLTAEDSGSEVSPVVYRAWPGDEVRISGGRRIAPEKFTPITDDVLRHKLPAGVLQLDLAALGLTEIGDAIPRGFWFPKTPAEMEVFGDDRPLPMSRWPREGYAIVGKVLEVGATSLDPNPTGSRCAIFTGDLERIRRWSRAESLRCFGYWKHAWSPATQPVAELDHERGLIRLATETHYGIWEGRKYCVLNAVEEITQPGDWALDRSARILYIYPTQNWQQARIVVSYLAGPLISLEETQHVVMRDLIIECSRGMGVSVTGQNNLLAGCTVRNVGGLAVSVNGRHNGVQACDIHDTGQGGIMLAGGDRRTLTAGSNWAVNNHIHDFNRISYTYNPGIGFDGVGHRAAHNHIHSGPHNAILIWGNDHLMEYNEFDHLAIGTDDASAIYMGRNPSEQGNVIQHNFFHHIGTPSPWGTAAIYADDGICGLAMRGNVFYRCGHAGQVSMAAIFLNAGKDHLIEQNLFVDCRLAVGFMFPTQADWEKMVAREGSSIEEMRKNIYETVDIDSPVFRARYPHLAHLAKNASRNTLRGNLTVNCGRLASPEERQVMVDNHETSTDPGFVDIERMDFRIRGDVALANRFPGFAPPSIDMMGLRVDEYRKTLPPRDLVDCKVEVIERPVMSCPGETAQARIAVKIANLSTHAFVGQIECWTNANDCVRFPGATTLDVDVPANGLAQLELPLTVTSRPDAKLMVGAMVVKGRQFLLPTPLRPEYRCHITRVAALPDLDNLGNVLESAKPLTFLSHGQEVGKMRLAIDSRNAGIHAQVKDSRVTEQFLHSAHDGNFWGGPYLGLLAAKPEAKSTREVQQVVFFPHGAEGAGSVWRFNGHEQVPVPTFPWRVHPCDGGYELAAMIPLDLLGLDGNRTDFLFEAMVNLRIEKESRATSTTLFGSRTAQLELPTLAKCTVG